MFLPDGSGPAMALMAYFDGSKREGGILTVAGFAYGMDNAKKASAEWNDLLDGKVFHMTDLHGLRGEFSNMTSQQSGELLVKAVEIINKYRSFTVAVSCRIPELVRSLPSVSSGDMVSVELLNGFKNPYAFCCHVAMYILGGMVRQTSGSNSVNYVFELGDDGQPAAKRYAQYLLGQPESLLSQNYCLSSLQHVGKDSPHVLAQTSDYLAWEWCKHIERRSEGKPIRPPLEATLVDKEEHQIKYGFTMRSPKCVMTHFEGEKLSEILSFYKDLLGADHADESDTVMEAYGKWLAASNG